MKIKIIVTALLLLVMLSGCSHKTRPGKTDIFDRENLVAWCIVPFDAAERSPMERAIMLNELGISQLAYDYRDKHIPSFESEIKVLKEHNIKLSAVWLWLDPSGEDILGDAGRAILKTLEESGTQTEIWVSFPDHVFDGLSDQEAQDKAVGLLNSLMDRLEELDCTMALYNHGAWFGEPENQVGIIKAMDNKEVKIVYNFHHGHLQVDRFPELMEKMKPYLSTINLNGMKVEGPKILPLGEGDRELEMLRTIVASGYSGAIGIIGHTDGEDIKPVLEANLKGLEELMARL